MGYIIIWTEIYIIVSPKSDRKLKTVTFFNFDGRAALLAVAVFGVVTVLEARF
jgi:hypothetical protein